MAIEDVRKAIRSGDVFGAAAAATKTISDKTSSSPAPSGTKVTSSRTGRTYTIEDRPVSRPSTPLSTRIQGARDILAGRSSTPEAQATGSSAAATEAPRPPTAPGPPTYGPWMWPPGTFPAPSRGSNGSGGEGQGLQLTPGLALAGAAALALLLRR